MTVKIFIALCFFLLAGQTFCAVTTPHDVTREPQQTTLRFIALPDHPVLVKDHEVQRHTVQGTKGPTIAYLGAVSGVLLLVSVGLTMFDIVANRYDYSFLFSGQ